MVIDGAAENLPTYIADIRQRPEIKETSSITLLNLLSFPYYTSCVNARMIHAQSTTHTSVHHHTADALPAPTQPSRSPLVMSS